MNSQGDEFMLVYLDNGTMQLHLLVPPRDGGYKKFQVITVKKSGFKFSQFLGLTHLLQEVLPISPYFWWLPTQSVVFLWVNVLLLGDL